jgi:hypothetical protein
MRFIAVLALALILPACSSGTHQQEPTSASIPPSLGPTPAHIRGAPPPAWIETKAGSRWLAYSSFCWSADKRSMCVDTMRPQCGHALTPTVPVSDGETARIHLGFVPSEVSIDNGKVGPPGRTVRWHVEDDGVFMLSTRTARGDVGYAGCAEFT